MNEIKISSSKMDIAEQCAYHFWLQYVKKVKVSVFTHPAAAAGTLFHKCVELWYAAHRATGLPLTLTNLMNMMDKAWVQCNTGWKAFKLDKKDPKSDPSLIRGEVKILLESFVLDEEKRGALIAPTWIEKQFEMPWDTGKGYIIVLNGYMDRVSVIGDDAWITDYKTSAILSKQDTVDSAPQLTFYAAAYRWLAKQAVGKPMPPAERFVELYFPKFRAYVQSVRTKDHFDDLKNRLIKVAEMEISQFKNATPSQDACRFCQYAASGDCKITPYKKASA